MTQGSELIVLTLESIDSPYKVENVPLSLLWLTSSAFDAFLHDTSQLDHAYQRALVPNTLGNIWIIPRALPSDLFKYYLVYLDKALVGMV